MNDLKKLQVDLIQSVGCGVTTGHGDYCVGPDWCCGGCSRVMKAAKALTPLIELMEASRDELARSKLTSLPLKLEFARANNMIPADGFMPLNALEVWSILTRKRFENAVAALTPEKTDVG